MKIRNRIISILLVVIMALSMLPLSVFTAFAEGEPDVTEVGTWNELLNAVNSDKTYIKLVNDIEDIVPDDELPTKHMLRFDGGKDYVLDLNDCTLEVINHANEFYTGNFAMIEVTGDSNLKIDNGYLYFDNYYAGNNRKARGVVYVADTSSVVASKIFMKNAYSGHVVSATATASVTLDGGEYVVQNGFALYLDRQASLTLDGGVYVHTLMGDCANTQYVDGYGALFSESEGELVINYALLKSGVQVNKSQIGAFSTATHEVTINGAKLTADIFDGGLVEAQAQNREYYWYSYNQCSLQRTSDASFVNPISIISYEKKYPVTVEHGTAKVGGIAVTEAAYGETVTIEADTPEAGMEFVRWSTSGVDLGANYYNTAATFTMFPAPVFVAACYGIEKTKSVSVNVGDIVPGQKAYDTKITLENGVYLQGVEWFEDCRLMDEYEIFKAGRTYALKLLVYPPDEHVFNDTVTATVNGKSATASAQPQYAYVDYEFDATKSVGFSIVYDVGNSRLGVGGEIKLDTAVMADQSASFKAALDAGKVTYQWYKNGEAIDGATESVYNLTAEDAQGRFYVVVTADGKTNYGHYLNCGSDLYQVYLNATEIVAGDKAPYLTPATPGISLDPENTYITEMKNGAPVTEAQTVDKVILIPGRSYRIVAKLIENGADVSYGASVYVNGEKMTAAVDGLGQIFYDFDAPEEVFPVYYKTNGEIGIGATISVDTDKMCAESSTFKNAYDKANATYKTVSYTWYKNGNVMKTVSGKSYTIKDADKNSVIQCKVTLVDGKTGVGEQCVISNVVTVIVAEIARPKAGETRKGPEDFDILTDGVKLTNIMFWTPQDTRVDMQPTDTYRDGIEYECYLQFEAEDGFALDFDGEIIKAYIFGEEVTSTNSIPWEGKVSYVGEITATHQHQYSDTVYKSDGDEHWQSCTIANCPYPDEEKPGYDVYHYGDANATCLTPGHCSKCGAEYYESHDIAASNYVYLDDMKCVQYCATEGCDYVSNWNYHMGGTFDCQHKAICDICHHEYGDLDDHHFGEMIAEVPATLDSTGTKAHKDCAVCHKHFDADGNEIADLTIAKLAAPDNSGTNNTPSTPSNPDTPDGSVTPDTPDTPDEAEKTGCAGSGCGSSMGVSAVALSIMAAAVGFAFKKKED